MTDRLLSDAARTVPDTTGTSPQKRFAAAFSAVIDQRGVTPDVADDDDVVGPARRSDQTYARSAETLIPALDEVERIVRVTLG